MQTRILCKISFIPSSSSNFAHSRLQTCEKKKEPPAHSADVFIAHTPDWIITQEEEEEGEGGGVTA